jgi:WD40 repeat protein
MTRRISRFQRILVQIIVCVIGSLILLTSCQRQYGNKDYLAYPGIEQIDIPVKDIPLRNPVWSPDGNSIAVIGGFADTSTELLIYNLKSKETKQLIGKDEFDINSIDWSPNSDKLAVIGVPRNNERESGLWIFDVNGKSPEFLVGASDVSWRPMDDSLVLIKTQKDTYEVEIYSRRTQVVEVIRILEYISANEPRD